MMINTVNTVTSKKATRQVRSVASKWWTAIGYPRKADIEAAIRNITNNVPLNQPLTKAQEDFLVPILQHHAEWNQKRGIGIKHLEVRINVNGTGSTRGIWIVREDGSEIDISWVVALKENGETTPREDLKAAAREAIQSQMHNAHDELPCGRCPLCGEIMKRYDHLHADHIEPFEVLFNDFFGGREHQIAISNEGTSTQIVDPKILSGWRQYHAEKAKLRLVHKHCNLTRPKA